MTMSNEDLLAENEDLRRSLDEAQEILHAIRSGEVDALVLSRPEGEQVFTLEGADRAYRVLIEAMNEGAITMAADGTILFCNRYFADMVKSPQEKVIGSSFYRFISQADRAAFKMLQQGLGRDELILRADDETILPVYISINFLKLSESQEAFCVIVTDLIDQKRKEEKYSRYLMGIDCRIFVGYIPPCYIRQASQKRKNQQQYHRLFILLYSLY